MVPPTFWWCFVFDLIMKRNWASNADLIFHNHFISPAFSSSVFHWKGGSGSVDSLCWFLRGRMLNILVYFAAIIFSTESKTFTRTFSRSSSPPSPSQLKIVNKTGRMTRPWRAPRVITSTIVWEIEWLDWVRFDLPIFKKSVENAIPPWENSWRRSFQPTKGRKLPESSMTQTEGFVMCHEDFLFCKTLFYSLLNSFGFSIIPEESAFLQRKGHSSYESIHWCLRPVTSIFIFLPFLVSPRCRNQSNPISSHCF